MSLYYDLLPAACSAVSQAEFVSGRCGKGLARGRLACPARAAAARRHVWTELRPFRMAEVVLPGVDHRYLPPRNNNSDTGGLASSELLAQWHSLLPGFYNQSAATCFVNADRDVIVIDSVGDHDSLPAGSIVFGRSEAKIEETEIIARQICGENCGLTIIVFPIMMASVDSAQVTVVFSSRDPLFLPINDPNASFLGLPWAEALQRLGFSEEEHAQGLWPTDMGDAERCLYTARLFPSTPGGPRMSMKEAAERVDITTVLQRRRDLHKQIVSGCLELGLELPGRSKYLKLFELSVVEGWSRDILFALDRAAQRTAAVSSDTNGGGAVVVAASERSSKLARILAMTADLLGSMAAGLGGLRSGPARNPAFQPGLRMMESGRLAEGLASWSAARDAGGWLDSPARLVRAARHYEGGVQLLIRQTVMSARAQVKVDLDAVAADDIHRPGLGEQVVVRCPARLDLSGGWTDTPPICYELGGQVVDLAITLDGVKPIGCRAVRISEQHIEIVLPGDGDNEEGEEKQEAILRIDSLADMADHCNPVARGALVKCCLLASGLVTLEGAALGGQLQQRLGSGLRLELWSQLPQGSGLGTSSILAGAVVAACWSCAGSCCYTRSDLVHAVLVVEQLLTTGGGWQDQVGGLHPGLSLGSSPANTGRQVVVTTQHSHPSEDFINQLGKTEIFFKNRFSFLVTTL